jgi:hypothetical protein
VKKKPKSAYELWLASDEGKGCVDGSTINLPANQQFYLENRIWRAFHAGLAAAKKQVEKKRGAR